MSDLYSSVVATLNPVPTVPQVPKNYYEVFDVLERLSEYHAWCAVIDEYYPGAVRLEIETDSEYDDEGGTTNYIGRVSAYDLQGAHVPFSIGLETDEDALEDIFHNVKYEWPIPQSRTFDRTAPPVYLYQTKVRLRDITDTIRQTIDALPSKMLGQ